MVKINRYELIQWYIVPISFEQKSVLYHVFLFKKCNVPSVFLLNGTMYRDNLGQDKVGA
jgi:hypothetical protein